MQDASWKSRWAGKLMTREAALARIPRGARVFVGSACAEPQFLVEGLAQRARELPDTEILHILTLGVAPYTDERYSQHFRHNAFFIGDNTRTAVAEGRADYTPVFLSELPALFRDRRVRLDAALVQVTPPDTHGFVSLGVSVDVTKAAVESARLVIAEVNPNLPRTLGDSFVPVERFDALVDHESRVIEYHPPATDEVAERIGRNIAKLIDNGSTIQIGIGRIPNAIAGALKGKRDLGVHSEMFSDWLLDLCRAGAVSGRRKSLHRGKVIASFCMGTRDLYDFVDDNPMVELYPSEYTNNPDVIARNDRMVAINSALEIDLTGQVCSDSIGHRFYSGIGGQVDFNRGAAQSRGGKSIIALASTTAEGQRSTIVPELSLGAGVVTSRGSVRYVVTEWGWVNLHGKSIRERALGLINVAHPKFREELLEAAKRLHYVYQDQILPPPGVEYPDQYETTERFGDDEVHIRPVKPTDEPLLKELFYKLSDDTIYRRYFSQIRVMPHEKLQAEANVDYLSRMTLAALVHHESAEELIALAQYVRNESTDFAELSLLVRDDWQGRGIGTFLLSYLVRVAQEKGIRGLTAVVWPQNRTMLSLLYKLGYAVSSRLEEGAYHLWFEI
jgi:acyl-CoA hydrolase/GNAT superfamily N-acetyltransferase